MTVLADRIIGSADNMPNAMGTYHPSGTGATPMEMPLAQVTVTAGGVKVGELTPLITADGAPIPATAPGSWAQLHAAGRP